MADQIVETSNLIILGDFNIHINNSDDQDALVFKLTLEALGLQIKNRNQPTHRLGNMLDLIIGEVHGKIRILKCKTCPYISDHCTLESVINEQEMKISGRKFLSERWI